MRRALPIFAALVALACQAPNAGTTATDSSDSTSSSGGDTADPLVDRCEPSAADSCAAFAADTLCCSDDPTAIDLANLAEFVTPNYLGRGGEGTPIFSGGNNPLSRSGACVEVGSISPAGALADVNAQGCPVPCNPRWDATDVNAVCGNGGLCCQVQELQPEDCVLDTNLGDAGCFRPVTGGDITGLGGGDLTSWAGTDHVTHQDPSGINCEVFVSAVPASVLVDNGITPEDLLLECYRRLTVADQRGFCSNSVGLDSCPYADPAYIDACEQLNSDNALAGC